jgi:hypothetical protein
MFSIIGKLQLKSTMTNSVGHNFKKWKISVGEGIYKIVQPLSKTGRKFFTSIHSSRMTTAKR